MKEYFIFQYEDEISFQSRKLITVIFIHQGSIESQNSLAEEINEFFQVHSLSDKLVVILPEYMSKESLEFFAETRDITFQRLPGKSEDYFNDCLLIFEFKENGALEQLVGKRIKKESSFTEHLYRSGMTQIFKSNGGLVESSPDHHFVFPSGKHCSKFIRTGNVLIQSAETFFIALRLLKFIAGKNVIYCDTSSINILPFSCFELKRRFGANFLCPTVHSFQSYQLFESNKNRFNNDSLILISSSTSGNIIDRILKEKLAEKDQIQVVFFLGSNEKYTQHNQNILCNLTFDAESFPQGVEPFDTYATEPDCALCSNHSYAIQIRSDVFLTVQPKITKLLIAASDVFVPKNLSSFVERYLGREEDNTIIKTFYKDQNSDLDYEIFIDTEKLFSNLKEGKFSYFNECLDRLIDKHIPANIHYLIHLPDKGSKLLALIIKDRIPKGTKVELIELKKGFEDLIKKKTGCAVVVASCITTGKKLLHISRLLRKHEEMSIVYFVGILRTINDEYQKTLISNLSKGIDFSDGRPVISVERINCSIEQKNTSWFKERKYLDILLGEIDEDEDGALYKYVEKRLEILLKSKSEIGLSNNVFLLQPNGDRLILQKNFAFWKFKYEEKEIVQSEVYFTISSIITNLENTKINSNSSLQQSSYVRNLLSPANFHRFNDGIIQASILRAGKPEYFAYDFDQVASVEMKTLLLSMIDEYNTPHGEALMEFLLAIGLKKLRLKRNDLIEVLEHASVSVNVIIRRFASYILYKI